MCSRPAKPCRGECGKLTRKTSGYCEPCYRRKPKRKKKPAVLRDPFSIDDDPWPSEAELEQIIAERSKTLPKWWDNSEHQAEIKGRDDMPGIRIVHVRASAGRTTRRHPFLW